MRRLTTISLLAVLALVGAACRGGDDDSATTTAATLAGADTTNVIVDPGEGDPTSDPVAVDETTDDPTTTSQVVSGTPTYEVADRLDGDDGETIVVVIEPGTYTEVELSNLVFDIVDRFQPLEAYVVDDPAAVPLLSAEELTDADRSFLDAHTFITVTDGIDVTFTGPYSDLAGITVGS